MPCGICKEIGHNSRTCGNIIDQEKKHYCYILQQIEPKGISLNYVGYTVNYKRRLRQHNGIIKGGARFTKGKNPWEFLAIFHCPLWDNIRGLQCEWLIKHPMRKRKRDKRFSGSIGKINSLTEICQRIPYEEKIEIYVHPNFFNVAIALNLPDNIKILPKLEF